MLLLSTRGRQGKIQSGQRFGFLEVILKSNDFFPWSSQLRAEPDPETSPRAHGSPDTSKGYHMSLTLAQTKYFVKSVTSPEPMIQQRAIGDMVRQMRSGEESRDVVGQHSHLQPIFGLL